ncbi:17645_t:CDS:1, partial [Acaulospora morrowiae]
NNQIIIVVREDMGGSVWVVLSIRGNGDLWNCLWMGVKGILEFI